ncbi:MAG: hypothetical protein F6K11_15975 [Leptolyngbya sp. SIO3F4]|nr:hypothetical protein [Leptolyngbya sp. SIO3F4]
MRSIISKSLFLLTVNMGIVTGFNDAANAYVQLPVTLSVSGNSDLAQRPSFPSQPNFDRDDFDDIRNRIRDRDDDDFDDIHDRIRDRDDDDFDDIHDRIRDRDDDDFDDIRERIRDR